jgi:hypothetical protein
MREEEECFRGHGQRVQRSNPGRVAGDRTRDRTRLRRADCGLDRDGWIVVFEAIASMLVHDEKNEIFA